MKYDSFWDTTAHIRRVQDLIYDCIGNLANRAKEHDQTKLRDPEKELFDEMTPKLKDCEYGSDQYREYLAQLKPALDHHYENYDHHPEHFPNGIRGMSLLSLLEMLCDWKAAGERHATGSMAKSFEINAKRFNISEDLQDILKNTAIELGMMGASAPDKPFSKYDLNSSNKIDAPVESFVSGPDDLASIKTIFETPHPFDGVTRKALPRIILAFQYCPLDRELAMETLSFITKIQDKPKDDVVFLIIHRNDTTPPRGDILERLREKFPTTLVVSSDRGSRGHPAGCNGMWMDTMVHAAEIGRANNATGVFTFEPDCFPIRKDWIARIQRDWAIAWNCNRRVMGHLMAPQPNCPEHVNGNMILDTQILRGLPQVAMCPPNQAWDIYGAKFFRPYWVHSGFIINRYKQTGITEKQVLADQRNGVVVIHGVKDKSVLEIFSKISC